MSNTTNPEAWAAQERLRFIERSLWWRGQVKRKDLRELFGISLAQASSDLQRYLELNPTAARYDLKAKTYRGEPGMACLLHHPRLEEALSLFLSESGADFAGRSVGENLANHRPEARVAGIFLPVRRAHATIERAAFSAVWSGLRLRVEYGSLSGRRVGGKRFIAPHAFAHDGYRWHLRAWCEENLEYRDFVLSRIREVEWPVESAPADLPNDVEWETFEELVLAANPELPVGMRETVSWDFGMIGDKLRIKVRRAMLNYTLNHLRISAEGTNKLPPLLVVVPD